MNFNVNKPTEKKVLDHLAGKKGQEAGDQRETPKPDEDGQQI